MKRFALGLYLILASGGSLLAGVAANDGVTFLCDDIRLPKLSEVAAVTGSGNAGEVYRTRETLLHQAKRECKARGVAIVRFVPDAQVSVEPLLGDATR